MITSVAFLFISAHIGHHIIYAKWITPEYRNVSVSAFSKIDSASANWKSLRINVNSEIKQKKKHRKCWIREPLSVHLKAAFFKQSNRQKKLNLKCQQNWWITVFHDCTVLIHLNYVIQSDERWKSSRTIATWESNQLSCFYLVFQSIELNNGLGLLAAVNDHSLYDCMVDGVRYCGAAIIAIIKFKLCIVRQ